MGDNLPVINLGTGRTVRSVAAGCSSNQEDAHVCAILDNGSLKCWGSNSNGQLGQGNTDNIGDAAGEMASLNPISLSSEASVTASLVAVGKDHTCVILGDSRTSDSLAGKVKCFGAVTN